MFCVLARILVLLSVRYNVVYCDGGIDPSRILPVIFLGIILWQFWQIEPTHPDFYGHKNHDFSVFSILKTSIEEPVNTLTILVRELSKWLLG
jgi:hypothetical protein